MFVFVLNFDSFLLVLQILYINWTKNVRNEKYLIEYVTQKEHKQYNKPE